MKNSFELVPIDNICVIDKNQNQWKNLPYVGMEDIESSTGKFIGSTNPRVVKSSTFSFDSTHLLYGRLRPYLKKIFLPSFKGHCSTEIFPIKVKKEVDKKFLFYWFISDDVTDKINHTCTGARMPRANMKEVMSFKIPLFSLSGQKRIVKILDKAFTSIDKAKENAVKNLENSKELFDSHLQSVFANPGKDWERKKLAEVANLVDSLHKTPKYIQEGYPMVRVTDIKPGYLNLSKTKKVDKLTFDEFSKRHSPKIGDIVLSRVGSYGVSAIVNTNESFCLGQNTVFVIPKIDSKYFYYFLNSSHTKEQLDKMVSGTTQPTISLKSIKEVLVPIPSVKEQKIIVQQFNACLAETKKLEAIYMQKIEDLEELKKSVLQKAFNGKF